MVFNGHLCTEQSLIYRYKNTCSFRPTVLDLGKGDMSEIISLSCRGESQVLERRRDLSEDRHQ